MMSWGGPFVGRVEPPSKLVFWTGLHWGPEGFLEEKPGSFWSVWVMRSLVAPTAPQKTSKSTKPPVCCLYLSCWWLPACVCFIECIWCYARSLCVPARVCVYPRSLCVSLTHSRSPCARANTIKASHPAALLNYTPKLLKRHPQIRPPRLPRSTLLIPCGIYHGRGLHWGVQTRYRLYIIALTRGEKTVPLCGACLFTAP